MEAVPSGAAACIGAQVHELQSPVAANGDREDRGDASHLEHTDEHECDSAKLVDEHPLLPQGLRLAHLQECEARVASLVREVLLELRPIFSGKGRKASSSGEMFEVGWSFVAAERNKVRRAEDLASLPNLRILLEGAMVALGSGPDIRESHLNVICRRYTKGQGIPMHIDRPQMFCEDVYGCILHNTSDGALEFRKEASPRRQQPSVGGEASYNVFHVPEAPGVCFHQRGPARYEWLHGVEPITRGERISVTWRWFTDEPGGGADGQGSVEGARTKRRDQAYQDEWIGAFTYFAAGSIFER